MTPILSLYLDIVRFGAAVAVFIAHLATKPFTSDIDWHGVAFYDTIAVTVFFVLSGYVISYVTEKRETAAQDYFVARASRLYSVAIVALLLTAALDTVGRHFNPQFYANAKTLAEDVGLTGYLASIFFVNEWWMFAFDGVVPGTNAPYWSLSFEATYYLAIGLVLFLKPRIGILLCAVLLVIGGPTICVLFPVWLLGFVLYRLPSVKIARGMNLLLFLTLFVGSAIGLLSLPYWKCLPSDNFGVFFPAGREPFNRNVIVDYIAAFLFALHLFAARPLSGCLGFDCKGFSVVRWLGSLTFPLYLFHYPLLCFLCAIRPDELGSVGRAAIFSCVVFLVVVILTPICDVFRDRMRIWLRCAKLT